MKGVTNQRLPFINKLEVHFKYLCISHPNIVSYLAEKSMNNFPPIRTNLYLDLQISIK